jgi:glycine/D-amino acid oxidase-like deaminating enzyme
VVDLIGNGLLVATLGVLLWSMVAAWRAATDRTIPSGMPRAGAYLRAFVLAAIATGMALLGILLAAATGR